MLDYPYFKKHKIATDLGKQQELCVYLKAIYQINFTRNLDRIRNTICPILEEVKETILDFSHDMVRVFWFNIIL